MSNPYPWFKFFPNDWLGDSELSRCQPATRGLWIDAICRMHISDTAALEGDADQLARSLRCTVPELQAAIADLQATGAAEVTERNGKVTLVSRRRRREIAKRNGNKLRQARFKSGAKGKRKKPAGNGEGAGAGKPEPPIPLVLNTPEFVAAWSQWQNHEREKKKKIGPTSAKRQLSHLAKVGLTRALACIDYSIRQNYQGLYEENSNANRSQSGPPVHRTTAGVLPPKRM